MGTEGGQSVRMSPDNRDVSFEPISRALIGDVCARLAGDRQVRQVLPGGGRLNIDRALPFLCI
jgi:hypothetical protein